MVKNRISSQYVFGYQKFILYPEDYKVTKSGKKKVQLKEAIRTLGTHNVPVKLHPKVTAELKVVVKEEA